MSQKALAILVALREQGRLEPEVEAIVRDYKNMLTSEQGELLIRMLIKLAGELELLEQRVDGPIKRLLS